MVRAWMCLGFLYVTFLLSIDSGLFSDLDKNIVWLAAASVSISRFPGY